MLAEYHEDMSTSSLAGTRWVGALLLAAGIGFFLTAASLPDGALHLVLLVGGVFVALAGARRLLNPSGGT